MIMESTKANAEFNLCLETLLSPDILNYCLVDLGRYLKANSVVRADGDGEGQYIFNLDFDDYEMKFPVRVGAEWGVVRGAAMVVLLRQTLGVSSEDKVFM